MSDDLGKLMYEKQLFERAGNDAAVERINKLITRIIKERKKAAEEEK